MPSRRTFLASAPVALIALSGCADGPIGPTTAGKDDVAALSRAIQSLGAEVDPEEAARAARVSFARTAELARQYRIEDPPLIHNAKVNAGLKPRGLCWHWAEDMESGLAREAFRTLALHRAIANYGNPFRIDHSTVIISRRGDDMFAGIVLDPWRKGGRLTWTPTREDPDYTWVPRTKVFENKRRIQAFEARRA